MRCHHIGIQQDALQGIAFNDVWLWRTPTGAYDGAWQLVSPTDCGMYASTRVHVTCMCSYCHVHIVCSSSSLPHPERITTRPACRTGHTAVALRNEMLVLGGTTLAGDALNDLWSLNLATLLTTGVVQVCDMLSCAWNVRMGYASADALLIS